MQRDDYTLSGSGNLVLATIDDLLLTFEKKVRYLYCFKACQASQFILECTNFWVSFCFLKWKSLWPVECQSISKCLFGVFKSTKERKKLRISALVSKKRLNKNKPKRELDSFGFFVAIKDLYLEASKSWKEIGSLNSSKKWMKQEKKLSRELLG